MRRYKCERKIHIFRRHLMFRTMQFVLGAAALLLFQATAASAKDAVERPFRGHATNTWVVDLMTGMGVTHEEGVATHLGRHTNDGIGVWDLSGEFPVLVSAEGTTTAANGDQTFWTITLAMPGVVVVDGGTGRFEDATGYIVPVLPYEAFDVSVDLETMTATITVTYKAIGTLTY
jgi:hypothetical protein